MSNVVKELTERGVAHPPRWLPDNLHYLTMMGSVAYGVSSDTSDCDVYGVAIPPKEDLFPHLKGEIIGFGNLKHGGNRFQNYQEHHLVFSEKKQYDLNIYNIVDYFQLVMENNPNMIDSVFTPDWCVLHITRVGTLLRENRKLFLHRGCWHTFKGYAYAQVKKMGSKQRTGKRKATVEAFGFDPKFAYHVVRLLNEVEQILTEGDLDLLRNREQLKSIRNGEWTEEMVRDYFTKKELELETLYNNSKLPWGPKEDGLQERIKQLLFHCLEEHYGSLDKCVVNVNAAEMALREIGDVLERYRKSCESKPD